MQTALDPDKRDLLLAKLDKQRQLRLYERMLATPSFSVRTDLFCSDAADAYMINGSHGFVLDAPITGRYDRSIESQFRVEYMRSMRRRLYERGLVLRIDDLKATQTQLMLEESPTREAEIWREQKLQAISDTMAGYDKEFRDCRSIIIYGEAPRVGIPAIPPMPLPTDDELHKTSAQARERIAQIEHDLAYGVVPQTAPRPAPVGGAPKATSGTLCNGPVQVPQNGELVFKDLPSAALQITFDHDAWQPRFSRQSDGLQTLVMQSKTPGILTDCYMYWRIAP
jgi:hypothetical protein